MLTGLLAAAPIAIADDYSLDSSDPVADSSDANQVLEIPQQCDPEAIGNPCESEISPDAETSSDPSAPSDVANDPNSGTLDDYVNQDEAASAGPVYMPAPEGAPNHVYYSPSPVVVMSGPIGPGFYQTVVRGPGAYQSWTRGPGFYSPMMIGGRRR